MSIIPFQYDEREVRVLNLDGEPWFVLNDLCAVLGLARSASQIKDRLDGGVRQTYPLPTAGGVQHTTIVSEPGMYEVVIRSDKPEAAAFRRWITTEVLPSIRKRGGYLTPEATEKALSDPDFIIGLATSLKEERARRAELEAVNAVLEPKAEYVDAFVASEDLRILRNVAKDCGLPEGTLRELLIQHGWIYRESQERWSNSRGRKETEYRYSPYADKRPYFRMVVNHEAPRFKGELYHTLKITPTGALAIAKAAKRWTSGIKAVA